MRIKTLPKFYPTLYRAISFALVPFLPLFLNLRAKNGKEDLARIRERFGYASHPRPMGKLIWCHAASVGESLSLLPLLDRLLSLPQKPTLLVTTGTKSSANILEKRLPAGVIHQYIPVDTMPAMRRFIRHWMPDLAILVESELWPNMIGKIRKWKIPAALLNARVSQKSATRWLDFAALWIKALLNVFNVVLAQSEGDATRFRSLGAYHARCIGNLKAAALPLPYDEKALDDLQKNIGAAPVWVFASTHDGEEDLACRAHKKLVADFPDLLTIIVPRHPARADAIMETIARHKLTVQRRSLGHLPQAHSAVYLADTFNELGLFYRLSRMVCIGGSFGKTGGHNPLEAALFGCGILFGPDMHNFAEMARAMVETGAAKQMAGEDELVATLKLLLQNPAQQNVMGKNASGFAMKESHVLDRVMVELQPLLNKALL